MKKSHAMLLSITTIFALGCSASQDSSNAKSNEAATATAADPAAMAFALGPTPAAPNIPDQYVVMLKSGASTAGIARVNAIASELSIRGKSIGPEVVFSSAVRGFVIQSTDTSDFTALRADPRVLRIVPDKVAKIAGYAVEQQRNPVWGLDRIDAVSGLDSSYSFNSTGNDTDVYVFDTGILTTHREFEGRADVWADLIGGNGTGGDCNGHGTHVAGTVGGKTFGVAKQVRLHAVRVLTCDGSGAWSTVVKAIDSLTRHQLTRPNRRTLIVNLSIVGAGQFEPLDSAMAGARAAGILFVVATGNDEINACNQTGAMTAIPLRVSASTSADARAHFSNWGDCVDIFAPGQDIRSAGIASNSADAVYNGTSMSAPHVAGVAAQILGAIPKASVKVLRDSILAPMGAQVHGSNSRGDRLVLTRF